MFLAPNARRILETQLYQAGACNLYFPSHASAYLIAGMPVATNIVVCQKNPMDPERGGHGGRREERNACDPETERQAIESSCNPSPGWMPT